MKQELANIISEYNENLQNREYINKVAKLITKCSKLMINNQVRGHYLERNIKRLALYLDMNDVNIFVTPRTVVYGLVYKNVEINRTVNIKDDVHLNFSALSNMNTIITSAILEKKTIEEINQEIDNQNVRVYSKNLVFACSILINCAATEVIIGSNMVTMYVFLVSLICAIYTRSFQRKMTNVTFIMSVVFISAFILTMFNRFSDVQIPSFLGSINMLPGSLLITGVEDTMRGHALMGMSRLVMSAYKVFIIAAGIISGTYAAESVISYAF